MISNYACEMNHLGAETDPECRWVLKENILQNKAAKKKEGFFILIFVILPHQIQFPLNDREEGDLERTLH